MNPHSIIRILLVTSFSLVCFLPLSCEDKDGVTQSPPAPNDDYIVYSDEGLAQFGDIWTWDGSDWGMAPGFYNAAHYDSTAPEGDSCFYCRSGPGGGNYAGWGVFLVNPVDTVYDLSSYDNLQFRVKTAVNLKVEIRSGSRTGAKYAAWIVAHGWDGTDSWQQITIPGDSLTDNRERIFGPFMITVTSSDVSFYVDDVQWIKE